MILSAWLFIGLVAILATGLALFTSDNGMAILAGVSGTVSWGFWVFGSFNVQVVQDATVYTFTSPVIPFFGIGMALIPAYIAFTGPVEIVGRVRQTRQEEV